jgi:hypothetical protein
MNSIIDCFIFLDWFTFDKNIKHDLCDRQDRTNSYMLNDLLIHFTMLKWIKQNINQITARIIIIFRYNVTFDIIYFASNYLLMSACCRMMFFFLLFLFDFFLWLYRYFHHTYVLKLPMVMTTYIFSWYSLRYE